MVIPRQEVAKGIFRFGPFERNARPLKEGTLSGPQRPCTPSLVVGEKQAAIVDPGESFYAPSFLRGIKELGIDFQRITYICLTHIHHFHCEASPMLLESLSKAKVVVHPRGAPHLVDPTRLNESAGRIFGPQAHDPVKPIPVERIIAAKDGQLFDLGGRELEMVYAPGHAPHSMAIFDRLTRALFPGDYDTGGGVAYYRGEPSQGNVPPLISTIRRFQALNPSMVIRFARPGAIAPDILQGLEAHAFAVERVCLDGLKQKLSFAEINERVAEVGKLVPYGDALEDPVRYPEPRGVWSDLLVTLVKKYPDLHLELPADIETAPRRWYG